MPHPRFCASRALKVAAVLPGAAASQSLEANLSRNWYWSDVAVHRAIRKYFPQHWLQDVQLPVLEDLVNTEEFSAWRRWAAENAVVSTGATYGLGHKGWEALALGRQRGATGSGKAIDPVAGFGMG